MKAQDLKNSILQLAIQGKLVPQNANDEPAEVLYAKIQAEKQKLIKEGKIKKDKPLPPIREEEIPFKIPLTWKWVRLGDIASYVQRGKSPSYTDFGEYLVASQKCVQWEGFDISKARCVTDCFANTLEKFRFLQKGDLLWNSTGLGTVGRICLVSENVHHKCVVDSHVTLIRVIECLSEYIYYFIKSPQVQNSIDDITTGTTKQKELNLSVVINHLIPLPPLAEQKRIVAKIEELEPLVKQYGEVETELSTLNDSFPEQLKKSILQYAIQGKLIPQDVNDESAEVLYVKIQAEKQKLIKEGKIKKDKPLPPITTDEIPFDIPSTWKWVRLGSISNYSSVKKKISPNQIKPEMWSLDLEDIEKVTGRVLKKHFAKDRIIRGEKVCFTKGNILYNKLRPYLLKILIADDDGITTPELVPFNFYGDRYQQFFLWYLKSPYVDSIVNSESYGVKMPRVGTDTMVQLLVPLPPSAEQKRIVTKINELMQYCEELKHPANKSNVEPITIEWLIDKGFASCQQNGYTDINAILDELDIAVMQDRNLKKGRIEYDDNKKKFQIWVNDLNDNWTKTHELVHYVNDNNEIKLYGAVGRKDKTSLSKPKERNVEILTAEILMPEDIFISAIKQENIEQYALVDNAIIRKLGKQFRVSDYAVKIRLQNLGYHTK